MWLWYPVTMSIIQNAVMIIEDWPDVSFLVSSHVHDFRTHTFHDGTSISVDGGRDYIKRCGPPNWAGLGTKWMEFNLDDKEPFIVIKNRLLWGTRGKDGRQPHKWVRLMDCSTEHLQAILDTQAISPLYRDVIKSIMEVEKGVMPAPPKKPIQTRNILNVAKQTTPYIHKAVRPKYPYINPTLCCANIDERAAHVNSRTRWKNVTCPACLKLRN